MSTLATSEEGPRLHIRVPSELKAAAQEAAAQDGRSLSNLVLKLLRDEMQRRGKLVTSCSRELRAA